MPSQTALDDLLVTAQLGNKCDPAKCPNTTEIVNIKEKIKEDNANVLNTLKEIVSKIDNIKEETITQRVKIENIEKQLDLMNRKKAKETEEYVSYKFIGYMFGLITFFTTLISTIIGYFLKK